jgi:methylmalonyl-CoA/ethylmalonyl-CoA epimerase
MLNVTRFLNVSMIVRDLETGLQTYTDLFGVHPTHRARVPEMGVDAAIVPVGGGISHSIELVQVIGDAPLPADAGPSSYSGSDAARTVERFLERRGEGVYRLAFEVEDMDAAAAHLADQGVRTTFYQLGTPHGPSPVLITHPKDTCGVMFEFLALGDYELGAEHASWAGADTGIFRRFLNTSCAVGDLDAALTKLATLFGIEPSRVLDVPEMAVSAAVFTIGDDDTLEFFAPMRSEMRSHPRYNADAERALDRYLDRRGEGVYRLAFEVEDFDESLRRLDAHGASYVPFDLQLDTGPLRVAVVSPKAVHGVMIELCEPGNPAYRPG